MAIRPHRLTSARRRQPCAQGQVGGNKQHHGVHPNTTALCFDQQVHKHLLVNNSLGPMMTHISLPIIRIVIFLYFGIHT